MEKHYGEVNMKIVQNESNPNNAYNKIKIIKRKATIEDIEQFEKCLRIEKEAMAACKEKAVKCKLKMKIVDVEYALDESKLTFYFTAEGRIDFRQLVRDLAQVYRTRIELRQMGVRDEVKRIGGNGICGRQMCCCSHLTEFDAVTMKMAKEQNISLNPTKVSGNCGRLMCCLKYEDNVYEEKIKRLPSTGQTVKTQDGKGEVCRVEVLAEVILVKFKDGEGYLYKKYKAGEVEILSKEKKDFKKPYKNNTSREVKK